MRVEIQDAKALASLSLVSLRSYLKSHGWIDEGAWGGGRATLYLKEHGGQTWDILLPMRDTVADYARSMADAVSAISKIEERSQLEVFHDLKSTGADVIRIHSLNGHDHGALSLDQSSNLLKDAHGMLTSAARAAERPQATYRGRMSVDVAAYLRKVQPMSDYYEDYRLTLYSPVPAKFGTQDDLFDENFNTPFSRRATLKLAEALKHTSESVSEAIIKDNLDSFNQGVSSGVSANLCDSLASLADDGHGIAINLSWAGVRPSDIPDSQFQFSHDSAGVLQEAAKALRSNEPLLDESIIAHVVKLKREPNEFDGKATISYVRDDARAIRINVEFEQPNYDVVIRAFQERTPIKVDGDIYRVSRGYELRRPHNLSSATEEVVV